MYARLWSHQQQAVQKFLYIFISLCQMWQTLYSIYQSKKILAYTITHFLDTSYMALNINLSKGLQSWKMIATTCAI